MPAKQRQKPFRRKTITLSSAVLALLGIGGTLLSVYVGLREARQYDAIERLRLNERVDAQFGVIQDHLVLRENFAKILAALFRPPPLETPRPLGRFARQAMGLIPDIATLGWLPEVTADKAAIALRSLRASGVLNARFLGPDNQPVSAEGLDRPLYPVMDIAPERNRFVIGVDAGAFPDRLRAIRAARFSGEVAGTVPVRLVQSPETTSLLLYAPVFSDDGRFLGVLGFGYQIERLFMSAMHVASAGPNFRPRVFVESDGQRLIGLDADAHRIGLTETIDADETVFERHTQFGGQPLKLVYAVKRDLSREGLRYGLGIGIAGMSLTLGAIFFLGFILNRATLLSREVEQRRSAEDRMKVLIHELNHRVRNALSVVQAVVRLSFTPGSSLQEVQKTAEGRLQALSNAMTLLTASEWKSVGLRNLISEEIIPFSDRIAVDGADIPLKARAAQTFALLFYELAINATKHGALSVPDGRVTLEWRIDRSGAEPLFRLKWQEIGGPPVATPTRRGFGELLVRRIAPRDLAGHGTASYEEAGFQYALEAPLHEIFYGEAAA